MVRTVVLIAILATLGCSRPRAVEPDAPPAEPKTAVKPGDAPVDPALLLVDAELTTYLEHVVPLGTELADVDARFAARYHGTAVSWSTLVDASTLAARDALAVRHGYASWAAFSATHDKVVGAMGLAVARVLRGMNVAASMNRIREMEQQADDPAMPPDQKAKLLVMKTEMARQSDELRAKPLGRPDVPEANVDVLAPRRTELSARFKQLREALKAKADARAAAVPAPVTPAPGGAPTAPEAAVPAPAVAPAPSPASAPVAPAAPTPAPAATPAAPAAPRG